MDQPEVCGALGMAASRGVETTLVVDKNHVMTGATMKMPERLGELLALKVKVRLTAGSSGPSGIQHSKTLLCDDMLLVGSTNWTRASRSNHEVNLLVRLNDEGLHGYQRETQKILQHSRALLEGDCKVGQSVRDTRRARSAEPKRKLREDTFAKRHSIQIARRCEQKVRQAALEHRLAFGPEGRTSPIVADEGHDDYTSEPECVSRQ